MNDSYYYQKKREAENAELRKHKPKQNMSEEKVIAITWGACLLALVIFLFVMLAKSLEDGRIECESQGGEWHSTVAGKIVITRCDGIEVIDIEVEEE